MAKVIRGYHKADYSKGNPRLNLVLMERRLLLTALIRSNWKITHAMRLNFPDGNIKKNSYNRMLLDHQINVKTKSFVKISEMN